MQIQIRRLRRVISKIQDAITLLFFIDKVKLPKSINKLHEEFKFDNEQLREIKKGIIQNVNITEYAKPYFSSDQMKQLRLALVQGIPLTLLNNRYFSSGRMRIIRVLNVLKNEERKRNAIENQRNNK